MCALTPKPSHARLRCCRSESGCVASLAEEHQRTVARLPPGSSPVLTKCRLVSSQASLMFETRGLASVGKCEPDERAAVSQDRERVRSSVRIHAIATVRRVLVPSASDKPRPG